MDRLPNQALPDFPADAMPAGWNPAAWTFRDLLGNQKEHSPRSKIQTLAASGNVNPLSQIVVVSATATATLESAAKAENRWHLFINTGVGTMTVSGFAGSTSSATSTQYACIYAWCDGTSWYAFRADLATALGKISIATQASDYTSGTAFTPTIGASTTNGTHTYTTQYGRYIKVGRLTTAWINIVLSAKDAAISGNLRITNLPFSSVNDTGYIASAAVGEYSNFDLNVAGGYSELKATLGPNRTFLTLGEVGDNVAAANLTAVDLSATSALQLTIQYEASS